MRYVKILILLSVFSLMSCQEKEAQIQHKFALAIHGGAGRIVKENMSDEREQQYILKINEVLNEGYVILNGGGSSLDAVEKCINLMEDSPLFNAGKGAVFTAEGQNELDASIMDGETLNAGGVAGITRVKNPITLARLVMDKSPHVFLVREGAEVFAKEQGLELVDEKYFFSKRRWESYMNRKNKKEAKNQSGLIKYDQGKFGTVGAVALDKDGNLAAGTSTGGMTYKKFGRVGDSPIIGAGTYANNETCAISATGHGEFFIRNVVAYDISALMQYKGYSLKKASEFIINKKLVDIGARGGIIAMDSFGNIAMPFNTEGMHRGFVYEDGKTVVKMFKN